MWKVILLCAFVGITAGELATYENYKLYRVIPKTEEQISFLQFYYQYSTLTGYDIWNMSTAKFVRINIMVPPDEVTSFEQSMKSVNMYFTTLEDNVQTLINVTTKEGQSSSFDFTSYHTLEKIYENLDVLAEMYPENVKIIMGGWTYEGWVIKGVKISFKPNNPGVFLEGGMNAREWMAPAVVMYIIHQLLTSNDIKIRNMAESHDWYIFPVFNPDGYEYTHTTDRMWIKNRKPYSVFRSPYSVLRINSIGINLNKNWDYNWYNSSGAMFYHKVSNMFNGPKPFSEFETKTMSEYIKSIKDKFFAYFSFHAHSSDVMYPPDEITNNFKQYDVDMMDIIGKPFIVSHRNITGRNETISIRRNLNVVKTDSLDIGSSITYIKGIYNKPLVLAYGLQDRFSFCGFLQPPERIVWFGEEAVYGLESILERAKLILFDKIYYH